MPAPKRKIKKSETAKKKKATIKKSPKKRSPNHQSETKKTTRQKPVADFELQSFSLEQHPITFNLSEDEINELLSVKHAQDEQQTNKNLYAELVKLLPHDEPIVSRHDPKIKNLIINNIRTRHETSPFVINLEKLIAEKEAKSLRTKQAKEKVHIWQTPIKKLSPPQPDTVEEITIKKTPKLKFSFRRNHKVQVEVDKVEITKTSRPVNNQENQFTSENSFVFFRLWIKPIVIFSVLALITILPIKGFTYYKQLNEQKDSIISSAESAIFHLQAASQNVTDLNPDAAKGNFAEARLSFEHAEEALNNINSYVNALIKIIPSTGQYLTDAKRLTEAGIISTDLGTQITELFNTFYLQENQSTLTEKITTLNQSLKTEIIPSVEALNNNLGPININIIPEDKQAMFVEKRQQLKLLEQDLKELSSFSDTLGDILGQDYKRRYLFAFQNNNEIRASGGFLGSLALVDIHHGEIINIEIPGGGSYDFQGSLVKSVTSPDPLHLINPKWELQDSNWFSDFPTSAQKIEWFYENAGGPSVDGIIAINATLLESLMGNTTPIYMPEYGKTVTADNVIVETQKSVELEYDKETNKPKQFIADLAPQLLEQLFNNDKTDLIGLVKTIKQGLATKEIQTYFNNNLHQEQFAAYGWTGEMKETNQDYLSVINSNIAGGKTDLYINQSIDHQSTIHEDGSITDTVTITREHQGNISDLFTGVRNVNYLRVYVPEGSILISADGFNPPPSELFKLPEEHFQPDQLLSDKESNKRIDEASSTVVYTQDNKTVFANWTQTDPGETTTVTLTYQLPFKLSYQPGNFIEKLLNSKNTEAHYSILYQKQSGSRSSLNSNINLPANLKPLWSYPEKSLEPVLDKNLNFDSDNFNAVIFTMNE
ncbi:hypothetical protein COT97_01755 [Candidatus Falkowbacteria bacterium CG10_big_fil_rev_8_21_14_0_10_39_11]|uniref:DUF4012 domain-containing protein n=1 Tax=Candidatus Falkowbacteria bacterium CG10_big_fil_rev_8_21_14_0_10_39_11 TaxID=1974565 RepID=A0A2H0V5D3_9BACT|nr:MAG: hypothetical protein COT97_01755 [Candidatus Falkowbacteria bacterium CG10_big_fil_rev_8_21_14_0_10_39_11]